MKTEILIIIAAGILLVGLPQSSLETPAPKNITAMEDQTNSIYINGVFVDKIFLTIIMVAGISTGVFVVWRKRK